MAIRAAVVKDGVVTNVIIVESIDEGPALKQVGLIDGDLIECPIDLEINHVGVGPGATYDHFQQVFIPALPPVPEEGGER